MQPHPRTPLNPPLLSRIPASPPALLAPTRCLPIKYGGLAIEQVRVRGHVLPSWHQLRAFSVPHSRIYPHISITHTHTFKGPLVPYRTTQVSRYQKGETNLDFTEARDSEWQWHQLGRMQVCISLQTDNHSTPPLIFLEAGCPSCHPTNSIKALKGLLVC